MTWILNEDGQGGCWNEWVFLACQLGELCKVGVAVLLSIAASYLARKVLSVASEGRLAS